MTAEPQEQHDDVIRSLGDSVLAGGPVALAITAAGFLIVRFTRRFRRG